MALPLRSLYSEKMLSTLLNRNNKEYIWRFWSSIFYPRIYVLVVISKVLINVFSIYCEVVADNKHLKFGMNPIVNAHLIQMFAFCNIHNEVVA